MNVGERIKDLRIKKHMTVDELAEKIGKNRATVYRYESNDIVKMPYTVLIPIAEALGTTPTYLLGIEDEPKPSNNRTAPFVEIVGDRISYIRRKRNMSIEELANKTGITPQQLKDMESGINREFNLDLMKRFCEVLGVQSSFFIDMLEPVENLGLNIKALREINELTENEVASELSISVDQLRKYENGIENIPFDMLDKLANFFNVDVTILLGMNFKARANEPHFATSLRILERTRQWNEIVGESNFTDEEMHELMDYAKYLISKRKQ